MNSKAAIAASIKPGAALSRSKSIYPTEARNDAFNANQNDAMRNHNRRPPTAAIRQAKVTKRRLREPSSCRAPSCPDSGFSRKWSTATRAQPTNEKKDALPPGSAKWAIVSRRPWMEHHDYIDNELKSHPATARNAERSSVRKLWQYRPRS